MTGARPVLLAALSLVGCSLTSLAERDSAIAINECDTDVSCPSGSSCVQGSCIADTGSLSSLLFVLSASEQQLAGQQLFRTASVRPSGGDFTLGLDGIASVVGTVQATLPAGCETATRFKGPDVPPVGNEAPQSYALQRGSDDSIPVRINFYPAERTLDLPTSVSTALSDVSKGTSGMVPSSPGYPFSVALPSGKYDVYIQPFDVFAISVDPPPKGCSVPPELIRGAVFDGSVQFTHRLPVPAHLDLKVNWRGSATSLDHWVVDMLEPATGRVISTRTELSLPTDVDSMLVYTVGIDYVPVLENDEQVTGNEIVRLSPPESVVAPSILFQRSALELFAKGSGVIDQLTTIPKPIFFEGQVIDAEHGNPQVASVTLTATELLGMPAGTLASFTRSVQTRADGTFALELLPGTYRVLAVPAADTASQPLAAVEVSWKIAATPAKQAGRAVSLLPARALRGRVITPWGEPARGAVIRGEPSSGTIPTDVFAQSLGQLPLVPRATSAVVDDVSGEFTLFADPGPSDRPNLFDLSVRPASGSGYGWALLPRFPVMVDGPDPMDVRLPAPVRLRLTAELRGTPQSELLLGGANLRVYALLDEAGTPTNDPALARSAVAIAESSLDERAQATVLLPPSLGQPEP